MTDPTLRHAGINLGGTDANADAKAQGAVFGFWIFLMSDAVIFALLFAVYGTAVSATAGGPAPSDVFDMRSALVPLHGLHVLVGSVWMVVMACQMGIFGFDAHVKINILRLGLFWHFLDVIWIAIVSCVYLQGLIR